MKRQNLLNQKNYAKLFDTYARAVPGPVPGPENSINIIKHTSPHDGVRESMGLYCYGKEILDLRLIDRSFGNEIQIGCDRDTFFFFFVIVVVVQKHK